MDEMKCRFSEKKYKQRKYKRGCEECTSEYNRLLL